MTGTDMHVEAWIDGEKVSDHQIPPGTAGFAPTGLIGLQVHGNRNDPPGTVAKFKNVRIRELPVFDTAEFSCDESGVMTPTAEGTTPRMEARSGMAPRPKRRWRRRTSTTTASSSSPRTRASGARAACSPRSRTSRTSSCTSTSCLRIPARTAESSCARSGTTRTPRSPGARSRSWTTTTGSACTRASSSPGSIAAASTGRRRRG